MINVLLLTRYERLGASSRIRFLQFLPELERQGFTFDVQPLLDNDYVRSLYGGPKVGAGNLIRSYWRRFGALRRRLKHDVVWLEKEALPWLPTWVEIARLQGDNAALKREVLAHDLPLPGGVRPDSPPIAMAAPRPAPSDHEGSQIMSVIENVWRRLVAMIVSVQKDLLKRS